YDIACQYNKKFFNRMTELPMDAQLPVLDRIRWKFVVPKLHIGGHGRECQEKFAFHLLPGSGQTDGKSVERHWAHQGPIGTHTPEDGPWASSGHHRRPLLVLELGEVDWAGESASKTKDGKRLNINLNTKPKLADFRVNPIPKSREKLEREYPPIQGTREGSLFHIGHKGRKPPIVEECQGVPTPRAFKMEVAQGPFHVDISGPFKVEGKQQQGDLHGNV
ncbi:hypothetical protein MPER_03548, partial [Moniliophthora perniciosa FA553]